MTEDETVGWHHRLSEHEFEQAPGHSGGEGSPACCSPWGRKESHTTERLNNSNNNKAPSELGARFLPLVRQFLLGFQRLVTVTAF